MSTYLVHVRRVTNESVRVEARSRADAAFLVGAGGATATVIERVEEQVRIIGQPQRVGPGLQEDGSAL